MLKKMRMRFAKAAMSAFFAVTAVLLIGINGWNYSVTVNRLDQALVRLTEFHPPDRQPEDRPGLPPDFGKEPSREAPYMMRYFVVDINAQGEPLDIMMDHVSSVSEGTAASYAEEAWKKKREKGFLEEYRYLAKKQGQGVRIVFLNAANEKQFMKTLLFVSCLVGLISLIAAFFLVCVFSGYAVRPYLENIERQKRFITDASHELKTPLASILTSADVLAMEEENEWVQNIRRQTVKLSNLVQKMVLLSKLSEERRVLEEEEFSFSEVVWEVAEPFFSIAKAEGKRFLYQIEDALTLKGDRDTVCQMVSALLDNAFRYSGPDGTIWLNVYAKRRRIALEMSNTCNIDQKMDLDRLFERFYRPDKSRTAKTGGSGIGLSIAKAAAEAHKGKITVICENGKKICFKVVL